VIVGAMLIVVGKEFAFNRTISIRNKVIVFVSISYSICVVSFCVDFGSLCMLHKIKKQNDETYLFINKSKGQFFFIRRNHFKIGNGRKLKKILSRRDWGC